MIPPSRLPPHPTPPGSESTGLSSLCHTADPHWPSTLHVVMCVLPSALFVPPSLSHPVSTSLFSVSASLLLPCKQVRQYRLSRTHTHVLIHNICPSLSDLFKMLITMLKQSNRFDMKVNVSYTHEKDFISKLLLLSILIRILH